MFVWLADSFFLKVVFFSYVQIFCYCDMCNMFIRVNCSDCNELNWNENKEVLHTHSTRSFVQSITDASVPDFKGLILSDSHWYRTAIWLQLLKKQMLIEKHKGYSLVHPSIKFFSWRSIGKTDDSLVLDFKVSIVSVLASDTINDRISQAELNLI